MKKILACMLIFALMFTSFVPAYAYTKAQEKAADALNELGLFLGDGKSYDLNGKLNRAQATTLLVRILGKEDEAQNGTFRTPFKDVPDWAAGYIGYAYVNSITNGTSATTFGSDDEVSDYMFLTLVLRALGYSDSGEKAQFVWNDPYALAVTVGLIASEKSDTSFTRGDAVVIFWNALNANLADSNETLADTLIEQDVFSKKLFTYASNTQKNGRTENLGVPLQPGSVILPEDTSKTEDNDIPIVDDTPVAPDTSLTPDIPNTPSTPTTPDVPSIPDTPAAPDDTEIPDTPSTPGESYNDNEDQLPAG